MDIKAQLITEFNVQPFQVENTMALLDEGGTVPFIARYRKEQTGELNEIQIRDMQHRYTYFKELDERRAAILASIQEQGKLTPELSKKISETLSKTELEDLYLPYKPKRQTRATKAKDAGLEPLARFLADLQDSLDPAIKAQEFINLEKGVDTAAKALQGACDILAEELSDDADVRKWLRETAWAQGMFTSTVRKEFEKQKTKFEMYYKFSEAVRTLPSHRILAMMRGEREKTLRLQLEMGVEQAQAFLESRAIKHKQSGALALLKTMVADAYERLLLPATETEIRIQLRTAAEVEAFKVFGENLQALLMAPPAGQKAVLGVDPGFRSGCKLAVMDATGKYLEYKPVFPHQPQNKTDEARLILLKFIEKHGIKMIAIGNGTASRETDMFVRSVLLDVPEELRPVCVVVNESGASVYSASDTAIAEFPDIDITVRGAISIGRRLQDPLSELVKIDPKAIGVGQYQHDINQESLKTSLEEVVESSVNRVGVNVNLASVELLKYVAGLNRLIAANIVKYRNENGAFTAREDLMKVSGLGAKKFEQAAGFLRVPQSKNPLDNSSVHPERYEFVSQLANRSKCDVVSLVGNTSLLRAFDKQSMVSESIGLPTIEDIFKELEKPGRDPRETFTYAKFSDTIQEISDLKEGQKLEGTVTNVANFGAFVDIGVHQDGLVHISELSDRYVSDPRQVVKVGQVVQVTVLKIDTELKRISLSMKTGAVRQPEPAQKREIPKKPPVPQPKHASSADLAQKFNSNKQSGKLFTVKPKFNVNQFM